jgi:hypothetical protein
VRWQGTTHEPFVCRQGRNKIMKELRHRVALIARREGRPAAKVWAAERGYSVKWDQHGLTVKPLA